MFEASSRETPAFLTALRPAPSLVATRLATLPFLSAEERTALEGCTASRRIVKTGTELTQEGEPTDSLYFLEEGWACQYTTTHDGHRQISAVLVSGDVCNLDARLFNRLDSGVRMLSAGRVLCVPRERVATLSAAYSGVAQGFTWLAFVENAILSRRTLCLGRLSAQERLAHLLCEFAVRLGLDNEEGEISFDMPLTQEQIADVLGLTPVHVNRTLLRLRQEGLLASTKRTIVICNVARLRSACGFRPSYLHVQEAQGGSNADGHERGESEPMLLREGLR